MTKDDFVNWKNSPVTKEIFIRIQQNVERLKEELSESAGINPINDRFKSGAIAGYNDLLLIDFEDTK